MPQDLKPMLASLVDEPFDKPDWIYEIKWDGYRALAFCNGPDVELKSRNQISFTEKYFPVTEALQAAGLNAVLDGELVAINEKGMAEFQSLQNWLRSEESLQYQIFDLLWLEGYNLTALPLIDRKQILKSLIPEKDAVLKYSDHIFEKGTAFFKLAMAQGLEGIMAKNSKSIYRIGDRTSDWLKIKVNLRQEVVIAGFTEPRNSRKNFGSLLLGIYENNELIYVGHTGSGFNTKSLEDTYKKLKPLVIAKAPFNKVPKTNMPATWVKPVLVGEIKFSEWTRERVARHPIFMGLRPDKKPKEVNFEKSLNMASLKEKTTKKAKSKTSGSKIKFSEGKPATPLNKKAGVKKTASKKKAASKKSTDTNTKEKKAEPSKSKSGLSQEKNQEIQLNGNILQLTNLDKLYWKKEGFTKGDMIRYYLEIAPWMMPYMKDRPQSLNRHPNGFEGPNFYQKDVRGKVPDWMKTHEDFSESNNETIDYLVCSNEASLIYMANLGCIEMNPWHSRSQSWENPDWCLIDLDPDKKNTFDLVIEVAKKVKEVLDLIGVEDACCKTSGSSGIHIYIPLGAKYNYEQSKQLAELIVTMVNQEMPDQTSMVRSPAKRGGKLYLDYLQNRQTQTVAAPYSLRPKPGVPVSTPIDWSELKKGLTPQKFRAGNIFERLKTEGDLFKPVLGKGINLEKVLAKLAAQLK